MTPIDWQALLATNNHGLLKKSSVLSQVDRVTMTDALWGYEFINVMYLLIKGTYVVLFFVGGF